MKKLYVVIFAISLMLSACGIAQTQIPFTPETSTPTAAQTSIPSTSIVTPLLIIPTFTPTFDISTIVTVTPAEKAECPIFQSISTPKFRDISTVEQFLNQGGNPASIIDKLGAENAYLVDITNDSIQELIVHINSTAIFSCYNNSYIEILKEKGTVFPEDNTRIVLVKDLNLDDLPELVFWSHSIGNIQAVSYTVFNWDNGKFRSLIQPREFNTRYQSIQISEVGFASTFGVPSEGSNIGDTWQLKDINQDGMYEMIFTAGKDYTIDGLSHGPRRAESLILIWDGNFFSPCIQDIEPPEYLYQAIQDADFYSLEMNFDKAFSLYQEAINNERLAFWTPYSLEYLFRTTTNPSLFNSETMPIPTEDHIEREQLTTYAYYRMMLLYLLQDNQTDAKTTYDLLQKRSSSHGSASLYTNMAKEFWNEYLSSHKIVTACERAVQFAEQNPEILTPLGSNYHGWQSHTYVPADICPFR